MSRPCSTRPNASNATPASTSARWTASPSPPMARKSELRERLTAPALHAKTQDLYISDGLKTGRIMAKDEDLCLHCGLCAERCPTGAWDMQKFLLECAQDGVRMSRDKSRQRFRRQIRQCQRLGLGLGQRDVRPLHPAHGRAGGVAQYFPLQHPGPAHLVRSARLRQGLAGPARRRRPDGGDEPPDLGQGHRLDRSGRLSVLRFLAADPAVAIPRRHQRHPHAADRDLQRHL